MKKVLQWVVGFIRCLFKGIKYSNKVYIGHHVKFKNTSKVKLGKAVKIHPYSEFFTCKLTIGENSDIGARCRICGDVTIEKNVLFGPNIFMDSVTHNYENINVPIISQGSSVVNKNNHGNILIGEGSWIGVNCSIIGDVHIGKNCVIGANSVVLNDVPDYCVVCGVPAKIVKRYNLQTEQWEKVEL